MTDPTTLPFFDEAHRQAAERLRAFARDIVEPRAAAAEDGDVVAEGRRIVSDAVAHEVLQVFAANSNRHRSADLRTVCLARQAIAASSAFADSVLAVHGLGTYPMAIAADAPLARRYLDSARQGHAVGAFALTEPNSGSDPASIATTARMDGHEYVLDGRKTLISNAGLATFYTVFARTAQAQDRHSISAFVVDADSPGFRVARQIQLMAPHPIGELIFDTCRVPAANRLGREGEGLKIAFRTLDFFRASVGAAACGLAERALVEALSRATARRQFDSRIVDFQMTRAAIADMATELEAAQLLVYRAAWMKDRGVERIPREASMAKLFATEAAQRIVDRSLQLHGGIGVERGTVIERLYREIRAMRIYEGSSEIQRLIIAQQVVDG